MNLHLTPSSDYLVNYISLLIGNIVTSVIKKHPTLLQIAFEVYFHKKKTIMYMHDYICTLSVVPKMNC